MAGFCSFIPFFAGWTPAFPMPQQWFAALSGFFPAGLEFFHIIFVCPTYSQYSYLPNYKKRIDLPGFLFLFLHSIFNYENTEKVLFQAFFTLLLVYFSQQNHALNMARYVLIDVSFREPIQTNMKCSKISPFVHGNISTNSVAKKYWYISLSISQSEPRPSTEKVQLFYSFLLL